MKIIKYYKIIILSVIVLLTINCMDVYQVRSEKISKPIIWGNPVGKNFKVISSFRETFWSYGGEDAEEKVEEICNTNLQHHQGDAIVNFDLSWANEGDEHCSAAFTRLLCLPLFYCSGKMWINVTVAGDVIKLTR